MERSPLAHCRVALLHDPEWAQLTGYTEGELRDVAFSRPMMVMSELTEPKGEGTDWRIPLAMLVVLALGVAGLAAHWLLGSTRGGHAGKHSL